MPRSDTIVLLSGGLDSAALCAWTRPALALFVDYGQRPALAERTAAEAVATHLNIPLEAINLPLNDIGAGLLHSDVHIQASPSPEWWPFRNQLLATAGAAIALRHGLTHVALGSVHGDGERHIDGSESFYTKLNELIVMQEGGIGVSAPAIHLTTVELLQHAGADRSLTGWTVSCHRANQPCGDCPGCWKRQRVLDEYFPLSE